VLAPVNIVAAPNDNVAIIAMAIYVDNTLAYKQNVSQINTNINMSAGNHYVVVQAWDNSGRIPKASVNIAVSSAPAAPTVSFSASPATITSGQSSTLSWSTTNASSVSIDNGIGTEPANGSLVVSPTATTTYTITATGAGGTKTATATVTVNSSTSLPTVSFTANPSAITAGQTATLNWSTTNATSVTIDNGRGHADERVYSGDSSRYYHLHFDSVRSGWNCDRTNNCYGWICKWIVCGQPDDSLPSHLQSDERIDREFARTHHGDPEQWSSGDCVRGVRR